MTAANTMMSILVRAGVVPRCYLLTTRGRTTGRARSNPVVPVEHAGRRWLVAPYGPVSWVQNIRAGGRLSLTRRGDHRAYSAREVAAEEAAPVLRHYLRLAPAARRCFQARADSPVEDFAAEADQHPVFELTPVLSQTCHAVTLRSQ